MKKDHYIMSEKGIPILVEALNFSISQKKSAVVFPIPARKNMVVVIFFNTKLLCFPSLFLFMSKTQMAKYTAGGKEYRFFQEKS